jgi:hypothetical protein
VWHFLVVKLWEEVLESVKLLLAMVMEFVVEVVSLVEFDLIEVELEVEKVLILLSKRGERFLEKSYVDKELNDNYRININVL